MQSPGDPTPIDITLSKMEFFQAAQTGMMRQYTNVLQGRRDKHTYGKKKDNGWSIHIQGACGEAAVARFLNVFWLGEVGSNLDKFKFDVGNLQVRTRLEHLHDLIIYPDDDPEHVFILVTGEAPAFKIWGWCLGKFGQDERFLKAVTQDRPPGYFVPKRWLLPMGRIWDELKKEGGNKKRAAVPSP